MRRTLALGAGLACLLTTLPAAAHPVRLGLMTLTEDDAGHVTVRLRVSGTEREPTGGAPSLPSRCRPTTPPERVTLTVGSELVQRFDCGRSLAGARVGVEDLPRGGVQVLLRYQHGDRAVFETTLDDATPTVVLPNAPTTGGVFTQYLALGVEHILTGFDHLLFVLGLMLLVEGRRRLLATVTSFTLGHSLTLALATLGVLHVPSRATEAAIALSILLLAVELTRRHDYGAPRPTLTRRWPWLVAALFGLLHGLGFAGALSEVGLPAGAIPASLFAFNVGVELGQLVFIGATLGLLGALAHAKRLDRLRRSLVEHALPYGLGVASAYLLIARVASFFT